VDADSIRLLYAYNRWANVHVLAAATALPREQLHRDLGTSHGSVFGTLTHILWAEWRWLGRWLAPPASAGPDPLACADLLALQTRWAELEPLQRNFVDQVTDIALTRPVTYENPQGTAWTYPLGYMLQHVVNHSSYHRGQVVTLLRQLGAAVVATDFLVFIDEQREAGTGMARAGVLRWRRWEA
jgi:uncharacterized damage-inducible protein DinB